MNLTTDLNEGKLLYTAPTNDAVQVLLARAKVLNKSITAMTYHKAFGIGCKPTDLSKYNTVILDEISMVNAEQFTLIFNKLRPDQNLIVSGDFGQLTPVGGIPLYNSKTHIYHDIFKNVEIMELTTNWRQKNDAEFFDICNQLRGDITLPEAHIILEKLNVRYVDSKEINNISIDTLDDSHICGVNKQVDAVNDEVFDSKTSDSKEINKSKVIMDRTVKDTNGLTIAKGQVGLVIELNEKKVIIQFDSSLSVLNYSPTLFKPAYGLTVHKTQGRTLKGNVIINPTRLFTINHLYVALTRATSLKSIYLTHKITLNILSKTANIIDYFDDGQEEQF